MKMKYFLCSIALACFLIPAKLSAQATIGTGDAPIAGALLDLKENKDGTSSRGLGLPRVQLKAFDSLEPCVVGASPTDKEAHIGLLVYNIKSNGDGGISKGLNIWNGTQWTSLTLDPDLGLDAANSFMVEPRATLDISVRKAYIVWEKYKTELGGATLSDNVTAELYWQDADGLINNTSAGAAWALPVEGTGREAKIKIETKNAEGNALVVVKIDGIVRWSWHIWVTNYSPDQGDQVYAYNNGEKSYTFMDYNLGANHNGIGPYYQWGRKDPFPMMKDFTGAAPTLTGSLPSISSETPVAGTEISSSLSAPTVFYDSSIAHWAPNPNMALWETEDKSIFDPCPAGWEVPNNSSSDARYVGSPWFFPDYPFSLNLDNYGGTIVGNNINFAGNPRYEIGIYPLAGYVNGNTLSVDQVQEISAQWGTERNAMPGVALNMSISVSFGVGTYDPGVQRSMSMGLQVRCVKSDAGLQNAGFKGSFKGRSEFAELAGGIESLYFYTPKYQADGIVTFTVSGDTDILNNTIPTVITPVLGLTAVQGVDYQHGYKIDLDFKPTSGVNKTLILTATLPDGKTVSREINISNTKPICGVTANAAYAAKWGVTWLDFACHNLGADETADPFTPSKETIGRYYQWGKKEAVAAAPHEPGGDAVFPNFEEKPITYSTNWNLGTEEVPVKNSEYDPCPAGWRVPTAQEWEGVTLLFGEWITAGAYHPTSGDINWFTAGNKTPAAGQPTLMLPAVGQWQDKTLLRSRGRSAYLYSSKKTAPRSGPVAIMNENNTPNVGGYILYIGASVRCIKE